MGGRAALAETAIIEGDEPRVIYRDKIARSAGKARATRRRSVAMPAQRVTPDEATPMSTRVGLQDECARRGG